MKRLHLFEIHDQSWCPGTFRDCSTDYLRFALAASKPYALVAPMLAAAIQRAGSREVLDLCSGASGPWPWLQPLLAHAGANVTVCLSDKYPNVEAFRRSSQLSNHTITYHAQPVDATRVPDDLCGFRTMFTAFHHLRPEQARAVLADAAGKRRGIGIFEATERHPVALLVTLLAPLVVLGVTPLIRPFRWSRLFWTYLIPVMPLVTLFDGLVSCLRTYSVQELRELIAGLDSEGYQWDVGTGRSKKLPVPVTYLIGVPIETGVGGGEIKAQRS